MAGTSLGDVLRILGLAPQGNRLGVPPQRAGVALFGPADQGAQFHSQCVCESLADEHGGNTVTPFKHNHACPADPGNAGKLVLGKLLPLPLGTEYRPQALRKLVWIFLAQERCQLTTNALIRVCPREDMAVLRRTMPN